MRRAAFLPALSCAALLVLAPLSARSEHTTFEFKVDRVEIAVGGGTPLVDEFDDSVIAPWIINRGTVVEAGGLLSLKNPGVHSPLPPFGVILDVTDVLQVFSGHTLEADFDLHSTWEPILPVPPGERFSLTISYDGGTGTTREIVALVLQNLGEEEAASVGLPPGLRIVQLLGHGVPDPLNFSFPVLESVPVSPVDVTGDIVLRIGWDATTRLFTTTYSLDGGATFQAPFATLSAATLASGAVVTQLIADPVELAPKVPALDSPGQAVLLLLLVAFAFVSLSAHYHAQRQGRIEDDGGRRRLI